MNKQTDHGLNYLVEIGFEKINGVDGLKTRLAKKLGKDKTEQILKQWENLPAGSEEFYEFKNSNTVISECFSELFDFDIIRKICNYIYSQKDIFGEIILEVGCESGYVTGFLAKTFPDAKIVSIDRSKAAVATASQRITSMGINNVEFRVASLEEISEKFDTVICSRTIQENWDKDKMPFTGEPLLKQFEEYANLTENYTKQLISCINEGGYLCVFERVGHDPLMCGWMTELCKLNCSPILETYEEIKCKEVAVINTFQAFICKNGFSEDPNVMIDLWRKAMDYHPTGQSALTGWNALLYLAINAGELIRGVRIFDNENYQVGRFAVFHDKDNTHSIYYFAATGDVENMQVFSLNNKEEALSYLQAAIDANISIGFHYKEMN